MAKEIAPISHVRILGALADYEVDLFDCEQDPGFLSYYATDSAIPELESQVAAYVIRPEVVASDSLKVNVLQERPNVRRS